MVVELEFTDVRDASKRDIRDGAGQCRAVRETFDARQEPDGSGGGHAIGRPRDVFDDDALDPKVGREEAEEGQCFSLLRHHP